MFKLEDLMQRGGVDPAALRRALGMPQEGEDDTEGDDREDGQEDGEENCACRSPEAKQAALTKAIQQTMIEKKRLSDELQEQE